MQLVGWLRHSAVLRSVALLAAWLLVWEVGYLVEYTHHVSVWFPVAGLTFASLVVIGPSAVPALLLGCVLITFATRSDYGLPMTDLETVQAGLLFGAAHLTPYGIGAAILRAMVRRAARDITRIVVTFLVIAALASLLTASLVLPSLVVSDMMTAKDVREAWLPFWVGDMAGVMALAPLFIGLLGLLLPGGLGVLLLINFAHGDIFMVGAYIGFFLATFVLGAYAFKLPLALHYGAVFVITLVLAMVITAMVGVTIERVAYRPLRRKGASRLYVVITALMCGLLLENGNLALLGASRRGFPELLEKVTYTWGGVTFTNIKVLVIAVAFGVFALLETIVRKTKLGMAMRAISYDHMAVPLMGIPVDTVIVFTFVLGSSMAALAGVLFASAFPVLEPYMGALIGWKAFIAAVIAQA